MKEQHLVHFLMCVGHVKPSRAGPEPGLVIIDSSCPVSKKIRLFRRV
jgi:hypothetical protein